MQTPDTGTLPDFQRVHLERLKLAADVILAEGPGIGDALTAELAIYRDRTEHALLSLLLAAVQGERRWRGCVVAGERGFRGGSGCGGVACDDTVSVSEWVGPPRYLFAEVRGEGREGARRHHCSR
jgi:hypothetical protein